MTRFRLLVSGALAGVMAIAAGCAIFSEESPMPGRHPEEITERSVMCTDCHEGVMKASGKPFESFSHTDLFFKNHGAPASRDRRVCTLCHEDRFCVDCHGTRTAVQPTLKYGENPELEFSHRGDYLSRHMFDGRLDPAGCFTCHGRSNNGQCRNCHKMGDFSR